MRAIKINLRVWITSCLLLFVLTPTFAQAVVGLEPQAPHLLKDKPVEAYRLELLDLAWKAATSYPLNPHIKNRARAEEVVVNGALAIDQPHLAWGYAKQVVNWRKGACHAEIAHYLIRQEQTEHVEYFLRQAILHSKDPDQGWRHARVKARVASARLLTGDEKGAQGLVEEGDFAGQGEEIGARAAAGDEQAFEQLLAALDQMVKVQGYDEILAAMYGYADLYRHYYADAQRRALLLEKTRASWQQMPGLRRFEVMVKFVEAALDNNDHQTAAALIDEADTIRQSFAWSIDYDLKLRSDIAHLRVLIGEHQAARAMLDEAVKLADEKLETLENFYRAAALRPVAEGFARLGDADRARTLYAQVVELGAVNPNLRPRISDITASCVSMAVHGIAPDAELLGRIQDIVSDLGN